jgi:hypothetical protein
MMLNLLVSFGLVTLMWLGVVGRGWQLVRRRALSRARVDPSVPARRRLAVGDITAPEFEEICRQLQR